MSISVTIEGDDELAARLDPEKAIGAPFRAMLDRSGITVANKAKRGTPVWKGRLRASLAHEVDPAPIPVWAKVGTNVVYGPFVEDGTRPHWPPLAQVAPWAADHGIPAFLVARAIARKGTQGKKMLANALESSQGDIAGFARRAEDEIVQALGGSSS